MRPDNFSTLLSSEITRPQAQSRAFREPIVGLPRPIVVVLAADGDDEIEHDALLSFWSGSAPASVSPYTLA